jgi:hypothetical protein
MEVKNSLDWANIKAKLLVSINHATDNNHENREHALKLLRRINGLVRELSYAELEARRRGSIGSSLRNMQEAATAVNNEIKGLDQWIFMLVLSK